MKKQLGTILLLLACSTLTLTIFSCSKSGGAVAGNYAGTLTDSLNGYPGVKDTVVITQNGNTITVTDNNTGSTFNGTLGTASNSSISSISSTTTPVSFTSASIKFGTTTSTYVGDSSNNHFYSSSYGGNTSATVNINLKSSGGYATFYFNGTKY